MGIFLGGLGRWAGWSPGSLGIMESALPNAGELSWGSSRKGHHAQSSPLVEGLWSPVHGGLLLLWNIRGRRDLLKKVIKLISFPVFATVCWGFPPQTGSQESQVFWHRDTETQRYRDTEIKLHAISFLVYLSKCFASILNKLDGVRPVDYRPSTDKLHHFVKIKNKIKLWHMNGK